MLTDLSDEITSITELYPYFDMKFKSHNNDKSETYELHLVPDGNNNACSKVHIRLELTFDINYPTTSPSITVVSYKNLNSTQLESFNYIIEQTLTRTIGYECLFEIFDASITFLKQNNYEQSSVLASIKSNATERTVDYSDTTLLNNTDLISKASEIDSDAELIAAEESVILADKDLPSDDLRVTEAAFNEWSAKFELEMLQSGVWSKFNEQNGLLTGKQLFITGKWKSSTSA